MNLHGAVRYTLLSYLHRWSQSEISRVRVECGKGHCYLLGNQCRLTACTTKDGDDSIRGVEGTL